MDAFAGTRGIGEQLARLAGYRRDPARTRALLPALPVPSAPVQPSPEATAEAVAEAAPEAPAWRYVEDPDSLLAHAVPTHGLADEPSRRPTGDRTMCGRRVTFPPSITRRTAQGDRPDAMAAHNPQPWPTCTGCQRAMPPGARELESARHARREAEQLTHSVGDELLQILAPSGTFTDTPIR